MAELVLSVKDTGERGSGRPDVGSLLLGHHTRRLAFWRKDLVGTPALGGYWGFPSQGGAIYHRKETAAMCGYDMGLPPSGRGNAGGGPGGDGDIYL